MPSKNQVVISTPVAKPASIPVNISAGLVIGVLVVFMQISLAALIFSGELSRYFGSGIGIMLLGAFITVSVTTLLSCFNTSINIPQDVPAAMLAVIAATIVTQSGGTASFETFATVVVVMGTSTILTGFLLWWFDQFNPGRLVRYLPYPVIGGFMAGTGWLLFTGGFSVLNDGGINTALFSAESMLLWCPALLLAVVMLLATRLSTHPLAMPMIVLVALVLFYSVVAVVNGGLINGVQTAMDSGWLLSPLPEGDLWRLVTVEVIKNADWNQVVGNSVRMLTIYLISTTSLLLDCSELEITTKTDIDLNRELKTVGLSNMASGVTGCSASHHMLSLSTLNHRLGATNRLPVLALHL